MPGGNIAAFLALVGPRRACRHLGKLVQITLEVANLGGEPAALRGLLDPPATGGAHQIIDALRQPDGRAVDGDEKRMKVPREAKNDD